MRFTLGLASVVVLGSCAWAQPAGVPDSAIVLELPYAAPSPPPLPTYAVTFAPYMLYGPVLQVNVERRLNNRFSASLFGGWGGRSGDPRFVLSDAGASLRLYPFKSTFRKGPHIGVQTAWAAAWVEGTDGVTGLREQGSGHAFVAGPLLGYKYTWRYGLTTELQILIAFGRMRGEGAFLDQDERPHWRRAYLALPLWNVGWSF